MRCSGWSSLAISICSALLLSAPAAAHVIATPAFLASGSSGSVSFSGPNEREGPMTGFTLTVPPGLEIEHAHPVSGWTEEVTGPKASWTDGSLAPGADTSFGVTLKATADPGVLEVHVEQRYEDGVVVDWPVPVTIVPAEERPSGKVALAAVVGLIGVLVVAVVTMLAWRRRT